MLKEMEAAPSTALPKFLETLASTRLTGAVPTLQKHLKDRNAPAAMAAATGLLSMGDSSGLSVVHALRKSQGKHNRTMLEALMTYWSADTPPDQVKKIRECLDVYASGGAAAKPCVTKDDFRKRFQYFEE